MDAPTQPVSEKRRPREREIVALLAGTMALNALALDTMLPALPMIGDDLGVAEANRTQLVIVAYLFGFGTSQMFWGPIADRFGRKPVLAAGIGLYIGFAFLAAAAQTFTLLVVARLLMGASAAVSRVLVLAIVRDLYESEKMARVMSLVHMVFMVIPVIAPTLGQAMLAVGPWRLIFYALAGYGVVLFAWSMTRLPETLRPEYRRDISVAAMVSGISDTLSDRLSLGYTLALTSIYTTLVAYLASISQIVGEVFERPAALGMVFAAIAGPMAAASWTNSRIVERFGLRPVGHAGMIGFLVISALHLSIHLTVGSTLTSFVAMMALTLIAFAFCTANFGTLAMTNMASIAGTASSVQGTMSTVIASILGFFIGQAYDGTVGPFLMGLTAVGGLAFLCVVVTERGRILRRRNPDRPHLPPEQPQCR